MKNSLTFLLLLVFLQSCKEKSDTDETPQANPMIENTADTKKEFLQLGIPEVYNGLGTFDNNGNFIYFISLPKETTPPYSFKLFNIKNETIFIHLDNKSEDGLANTANNVFELIDKLPKDRNSSPYKTNYKVFLWHDDALINNETDAERIMKNTIDSLVAPKKVGIGILSRK